MNEREFQVWLTAYAAAISAGHANPRSTADRSVLEYQNSRYLIREATPNTPETPAP